jgi:hypothetical protein
LFKSAQAMVRFSPVAGEYVFDKFDELEAADVSTALAEQLTVTREMVVRLRDSAMDAEERLTRNLDHVQKLLEGAAGGSRVTVLSVRDQRAREGEERVEASSTRSDSIPC